MIGLLSMQKVNSSFLVKVLPRAFLIFLVCLSLVAFSSYTAPKAQAEALSLTLTTAFIMLVIAVMGTLGVTLVASSNDEAVDYMSVAFGQFLRDVKGNTLSIAEYLSSIGLGAIGLLGAPIHGAISIGKVAYDLIAEFCTWFFSEKNVVSGGNDVGELPSTAPFTFSGSYGSASSSYWVNDTTFRLVFNVSSSSYSSQSSTLRITLPSDFTSGSVTISLPSATTSTSPSELTYNNHYVYQLRKNRFSSGWTYSLGYTYYGNPAVISFSSNVITFILSNAYTYYYADSGGSGISYSSNVGTSTLDFVFSDKTSTDGGFVVSPSDTVISPPSIAVGQTYNVPAEGVTDTSDLEDAIPAAIAPITTTGGLSTSGSVAGTAVQSEWKWLYEDTQSIRNNTDPHFNFIPGSLGFDFSIWHYVVEMMNSVNSAIALFGSFVQNMPPAILAFPFGVFALCITVALFRRFLS